MARINCEDDYWTDPRRESLGLLIGDQEKADGRMLRAWRISQSYWRQGGQLVPEAVWDAARLNGVIEVGLAERREGGIYCKGSATQFDWISQHAEAGRVGGKASAAARKARTGSALPVNARNRPKTEASTEATVRYAAEASEATFEAPPNPHLYSSPLSSELSDSGPTPLDLAGLWNELRHKSQPKVLLSTIKPGSARWTQAAARLRDLPDLESWREVVLAIAGSPWHRGESESGWKAGFDYLVQTKTYAKALEGSFNRGGGSAAPAAKEKFKTAEDLA